MLNLRIIIQISLFLSQTNPPGINENLVYRERIFPSLNFLFSVSKFPSRFILKQFFLNKDDHIFCDFVVVLLMVVGMVLNKKKVQEKNVCENKDL